MHQVMMILPCNCDKSNVLKHHTQLSSCRNLIILAILSMQARSQPLSKGVLFTKKFQLIVGVVNYVQYILSTVLALLFII